jgi:hypothetical protein
MWYLTSPCLGITGRAPTDTAPGRDFFEMKYAAYKDQRQKGLRPIFLNARQSTVLVLFDPSDPDEATQKEATARDEVTCELDSISNINLINVEGMARQIASARPRQWHHRRAGLLLAALQYTRG